MAAVSSNSFILWLRAYYSIPLIQTYLMFHLRFERIPRMEESKPHFSESTTGSLLLITLSIYLTLLKEKRKVNDHYFPLEIK